MNMIKKGTAIVGFVLSFVTGASCMYAVDRKYEGDGTAAVDPSKTGAAWHRDGPVPISNEDPVDGPVNAPVTVIEFSDFQCPYCSRVAPTVAQLKGTYGDKIKIVWKDLPLDFHKNAMPAAIAARVVFMAKGSDAFWKFNQKVFQNQKDESDDNYKKWAAEVGVTDADFAKYKVAAEQKVKANLADAQKLGVQGTPNFLIDGEALTGAQPIEKFKSIVDAHLKKAAELKANGVSDDALYAELTKNYFQQKPAAEDDDEQNAPPVDDFAVWNVPIGDSPLRVGDGSDPKKHDALVTIVVFSDFQCPFCKRVEPSLAQAAKDYGDKVRFVWKNYPLPFHDRAMQAAQLAMEAKREKGDAGFWKAHDALFESQPKLADADLEAIAKTIGLDVAKVDDAIKSMPFNDAIQSDMDLGEDVGVRGTPKTFVNGRIVDGAQPYEAFKHVIDQEIPKAQAKIAAGTPIEKLYEEIIKAGKGGALAPLPIPSTAPWKGGRDAKVVIQVFSDFQCPFCKRAEVPMPGQDGNVDPNGAGLKAAIDKYGDKIKVVWRNFPLSFHDRAEPVAEFAIEAMKEKGSDAFWKVHDDLFDAQPKLDEAELQSIATKEGIDWAKAKAAIDTHAYKSEIDADQKDGGSIGVTGTPGFLIQTSAGAKLLVGAQPADAFFKAIDAALAKQK
jgi:protein-disulfide isomerase